MARTVVAYYFYHDMPVSKDDFSGMRLVRDSRVIARAGIDAIGLVPYERGGSAVAAEGMERTLGAGDILAIDYARGATLAVRSSGTISVTIPRALLMPLIARPDRVHGSVLRSGTPLHALLAGHLHGETLSSLAEHWGFPDRTVFSRAYRTLYGMSPTDARALARASVREAHQTSATIGSF